MALVVYFSVVCVCVGVCVFSHDVLLFSAVQHSVGATFFVALFSSAISA